MKHLTLLFAWICIPAVALTQRAKLSLNRKTSAPLFIERQDNCNAATWLTHKGTCWNPGCHFCAPTFVLQDALSFCSSNESKTRTISKKGDTITKLFGLNNEESLRFAQHYHLRYWYKGNMLIVVVHIGQRFTWPIAPPQFI